MHDLSLHVMDLIENSVRAHATVVSLQVIIDVAGDRLQIRVEDDGVGIQGPPEAVFDPFYTTSKTKKVGLGLSFLKGAAELAGGGVSLSRSAELGGTTVTARIALTHVNRPALGDLAATISTMILLNPGVDFRLQVSSGAHRREFCLSRFMAERGLSGDANVQVAASVLEHLRKELEPWTLCERISWVRPSPSPNMARAEATC